MLENIVYKACLNNRGYDLLEWGADGEGGGGGRVVSEQICTTWAAVLL